jgi:lipopolysaccharide export system permease protein
MLQIVDRYLLSEVLKTFLAIVFTLMLIVASMLFLRTLEEVSLGALNADLVLKFLGLQLVRDTSSVLPPAFFIAALAALSRLARDSELIALHACGVGPGRVYRDLLVLAVPVALLTGWFAVTLQPWAASGIAAIRLEQKEQAAQVAGLQAGRFYVEDEGKLVVYIGAIDRTKGLERVFILDRRDQTTRVVVSDRGRHRLDEPTGDHLVTLIQGHRFDGNAGQGNYLIGDFDEYEIRLRTDGAARPTANKRSTASTLDLLRSPDIEDRTELEHRLSAPLAIFTLAILAVPLVNISPRQRTSGRLFLAFIAYFSFFNLQRLAESWLAAGVTPPWLTSLWYQALILALVYAALTPGSLWQKRLRERLIPARRLPASTLA